MLAEAEEGFHSAGGLLWPSRPHPGLEIPSSGAQTQREERADRSFGSWLVQAK